jgi:DNA-binding NtrC family response regulator
VVNERIDEYPWPGNVLELKNTIENIILIHDGEHITDEMLPVDIATNYRYVVENVENYNQHDHNPYKMVLDKFEKMLLILFLLKNKGNQSKVSKITNVHRNTILNKVIEFELDAKEIRRETKRIL